MREVITSHGNTTVKRLKSLRLKKHRRAEGLFLAEGLRILLEALDEGRTPEILLHAAGREGQPALAGLISATAAAGGQVLAASEAVLSGVSGKDNPQMVLGAFAIRHAGFEALRPEVGRLIAAERLRDPGNLGTLLRACDGAGAGGMLLLDDCADPWSVEAVRASMGAIFTVPVVQADSAAFLDWAAGVGAHLVGATIDPRAIDYRQARFPPPCCILLGNEQQGLPPHLRSSCATLAMIPMRGRADSLNVAMAGTLLLYEALRRQEPLTP
jgi:TrmH family RNA methyltransferase